MNMEQSVPKRRHIKFRRRRITQKKAYNEKIAVPMREGCKKRGKKDLMLFHDVSE
jgi:hypothetical protein